MTGEKDVATYLATQIMALDWMDRRKWAVESQADRHGELQEMIDSALAPILAEKERQIEKLHATVRKAHVAMTMACALPGVAAEYDFSEAIASTEATLARRAAAIRAQGE